MDTEDPSELGNWLKQRVLGSGGFGVVTLWKNKQTGETIALKKCRSGTDSIMTPKHKERWTNEVEIMQRLNHPNVVKAIQVPVELSVLRSELPLLCMEFCSKGDLRQVLNRGENCCGLNEADVRSLISDVKSAIQYLHTRRITHRDLKPENIVLQQNEKKIVYKLIDLGYAKELEQSSLCTSFVGTLQYLAPELFSNKPYTSSVDYWSLGLLSHEVITGVRPFLPNMTPAAWMSHVRNKSSDDICAYQSPDGSIVFSTKLYDQNHISLALKHDMEQWLKLALEWNPEKRGRRGPGDKVIIFDMLDEILSKKIVQLFVVPLYLHCSYVIDSSTALSTLQVWLERDTALAVSDQELLLPSGKPPNPDAVAMQCWDEKCIENGTPMLLVFKKGELTLPQVGPRIPWTVQQMLQEPRTKLEYVHLRRAWAHASFFLRQEADLYHTLVAAFQTKMKHVEEMGNEVAENLKDAMTSLERVEAQMDIVHSSLKLDEEKAAGRVPASVMQRWARGYEQIKSRVVALLDILLQLKTRSESTSAKLLKLHEEPIPPWQDMAVLSESGLKCYDQLRRRSRESRHQKSDCIDMLKIVYSCLKRRDALLRDKAFAEHLKLLAILQKDFEMLHNPLNRAIELIEKVGVELKEEQLKRQNDIWRSVMGLDATQNSVGHISPAPSMYLDELQELKVPELTVTNFNIGGFIPDRSLADGNLSRVNSRDGTPTANELRVSRESSPIAAGRVSPFTYSDTTTIVQDNFELRHRTNELIHQSYQQYRSIMDDLMSMDWTHLEQ